MERLRQFVRCYPRPKIKIHIRTIDEARVPIPFRGDLLTKVKEAKVQSVHFQWTEVTETT
jgi:hypothetical protein